MATAASTERRTTGERPEAGVPDARARLKNAEALQKAGKVSEAIDELIDVAALYTTRGVPIKAVAVLRQAVRLQPDNADLRIAYGEVFGRLQMVDDAAREYLAAGTLLDEADRHEAWLGVLERLLALDASETRGRVALAEALVRAGRAAAAARIYRELANALVDRGEVSDWVRVAERIVQLDPDEIVLAHDLALHHLRSGAPAQALWMLYRCFERDPSDVELLELMVDALEQLGQPQRAALVQRNLVERHKAAGLTTAAKNALQRLHELAPDDDEAREAAGVLQPAVATDTVLELEGGDALPAPPEPEPVDEDGDFEGGFGFDAPAPAPPAPALPPEPVAPPAPPAPIEARPRAPSSSSIAQPTSRPSSSSAVLVQDLAAQVKRAERHTDVDEEIGFGADGQEDRTIVQIPSLADAAASFEDDDSAMPPPLALDLLDIGADPSELPTTHLPAVPPAVPQHESPPPAVPVDDEPPSIKTRKRGGKRAAARRPRLSRATRSDMPAMHRGLVNDLKTVDFFIERGFHESAVALVVELERKHPGSPAVTERRQQIEAALRGG